VPSTLSQLKASPARPAPSACKYFPVKHHVVIDSANLEAKEKK
jgi:hypothetical protein